MAVALGPDDTFLWGAGGTRKTAEQIAREREVALALGQPDFSPAGHWSVALGRGLQGALSGLQENRLNSAETANQGANSNYIAQLLAGVPGAGGPAAAAPAAVGGAAPSSSMAGTVAPDVPPDLASGISATAQSLGIDPVDLATAISYETAGTFDPTKAGPTTQWGQHRGLIQFGEPQAKQYGVDWNNPIGSQLGPEGAVAKYLRDAGVKPGMGMMDIYSAINAGGTGRYNASDANNGGAPGTVADKVNQQMAGHRAKAVALLGQGGAPAGVQVASTDPSAGVAQALAMQPSDVSGANALAVPAPVTGAAPQRVAQAPMPPSQQPQAPAINPAILRALSDPYASREVKGVAQALLGQQAQAAAAAQQAQVEQQNWLARQQYEQNLPINQVNLEKARLEAENLRNPIQKPTNDIQEYEYAKSQGFTGTLPEYQQSIRKAGAPVNNVNVGEGDKFYNKLDESNASMFGTLQQGGIDASQNLARIDRLDTLLQNAPTGATANFQVLAGEYGIPTEGLDNLQAAQALINQLVPAQRPAGSGPMSDKDIELFKQGVPRIINQPGGNRAILDTMRGIAQYTQQQGEIANRVANREMSPADGRKALSALPNPLANVGKPAAPAPPAAGTVKNGYRFKGGNPGDKTNWEPI